MSIGNWQRGRGTGHPVIYICVRLLWARGWCRWAGGSGRAGRAGGVAEAGRGAGSAVARPSGRPSIRPGPAPPSPRARPHWCRTCQTPSLWSGETRMPARVKHNWETEERQAGRECTHVQYRMVPGVGGVHTVHLGRRPGTWPCAANGGPGLARPGSQWPGYEGRHTCVHINAPSSYFTNFPCNDDGNSPRYLISLSSFCSSSLC